MRPITTVLFVAGILANVPVQAQIVDVGYAQYQGAYNASSLTTQFLGMRYAAPPVGDLRWRAPVTPTKVAGLQNATNWPPICPSTGFGLSPTSPFRNNTLTKRVIVTSTSEDCLFLNVFVPGHLPSASAKKLPVVVWIHGGGYMAGSSLDFNGNDLIIDSNYGVVVVTIQYRLGVWGFLPGEAVKNGGDLNTGLLDQHFALQWVQQNIAKFGGDPTKVTIWGESAGAGSVLQHVVAQGGKTNPPLFRAAMSSSSFLPSQYHYNDTIPEALYSAVIAQTNCTSAADILKCLRGLSTDALQTANVNVAHSYFYGTFSFVPVVDGTFITQRPYEAFQKRQVNGKALFTVTNTFEGTAFVDLSTAPTVQAKNYIAQLFPLFGQKEIDAAAALYTGLGAPIDQAIAIQGESIFICPTYNFMQAFGSQAYKGEFAIQPGGHGQDVSYYFFSQDRQPAYNSTAFVKAFAGSFLNFAISLDPNVKTDPTTITPQWNRWNTMSEMLFNKTETNEPVVKSIRTSKELLKRCAFWESVGALTGQ